MKKSTAALRIELFVTARMYHRLKHHTGPVRACPDAICNTAVAALSLSRPQREKVAA